MEEQVDQVLQEVEVVVLYGWTVMCWRVGDRLMLKEGQLDQLVIHIVGIQAAVVIVIHIAGMEAAVVLVMEEGVLEAE